LQWLPTHPHQPACPPVVTGAAEFRRSGCVGGGLFNKPDLADLAVGIAEHHIPALAFRQVVVGGVLRFAALNWLKASLGREKELWVPGSRPFPDRQFRELPGLKPKSCSRKDFEQALKC